LAVANCHRGQQQMTMHAMPCLDNDVLPPVLF
jgi:hypothetical protein